jgi:DNA-binding NtrC family response regulator
MPVGQVPGATCAGDRDLAQVLIVEDEERIARAYARALSREPLAVYEAHTARTAIRMVKRMVRLDAVLLDLRLGPDRGELVLDAIEQRGTTR